MMVLLSGSLGGGIKRSVKVGSLGVKQRKIHKSRGNPKKDECRERSYQEGVSHLSLKRTFFVPSDFE